MIERGRSTGLVVCAMLCATVPAGGQAPGEVFRDCEVCPEMVTLPGGDVALGRYEVTLEEYRAFAEASTEVASENNCFAHGPGRRQSWQDPGLRADGATSGGVRELVRSAGVCGMAVAANGPPVSPAHRGGMGPGRGGQPPRVLHALPQRRGRDLHGGLLRSERRRPLRHGGQPLGVDGWLLGRALRPKGDAGRRLGESGAAAARGCARVGRPGPPRLQDRLPGRHGSSVTRTASSTRPARARQRQFLCKKRHLPRVLFRHRRPRHRRRSPGARSRLRSGRRCCSSPSP